MARREDRGGWRIGASRPQPGRYCLSHALGTADRADVRPESDVRQFARSALEGADVGFVVFRAVRDEGVVDWVVLDANAFIRDRWVDGDAASPATACRPTPTTPTARGSVRSSTAALDLGRAGRDRSRDPPPVGRDLVAAGHRDPRRRRRRRDDDLRHRRARRRARPGRRAVAAQLRHRRDHQRRQRALVGVARGGGDARLPGRELVGRCTVDLVHPDDVDAVVDRFLVGRGRRRRSCRRSSSGCSAPTASTSGSSARSRTGSTTPTCAASS